MSVEKCNICGGPYKHTYEYVDPETNKVVRETKTINCLGHYGIHPAIWNRHPDHHKFLALKKKQQRAREQQQNQLTSGKECEATNG